MNKLEIPIVSMVLWNTGDRIFWVDVKLLLKDQAGIFHKESFRVDTGTHITTMLAYDAKQLSLPLPLTCAPVRHDPTGLEVRTGLLRFRVVGLDPTDYASGCFFLGDPDTPPPPHQPAMFRRKLLQPLQLLEHLRFTFDRDAKVGAAYGTLTIEQKGP